MKRKELQTWKQKTPPEIEKELRDAYHTLNRLTLEVALGKAKNVRDLRAARKTIAQLRTIARANTMNL